MIFTIIIPMYNVAEYIERCLASIYQQSFDESLFEVILVDDESPDNSKEIAENYIKNKSNYTIISQKNKGLGGARNTAIERAKGDYLIFLDSDDYLLEASLAKLNKLKLTDDIIEFSVSVKDSSNELSTIDFENTNSLTGCEYILKSKSINSSCNKLYKTSFVKMNNLFFKEKIYGEDIEFNSRAFFHAQRVKSIKEKLIVFYQSDNSITRNRNNDSKIKYLTDLKTTIISLKNFKDKLKEINEVEKEYWNYRLTSLNVNTLLFSFKNKLPREVVLSFVNDLKLNNAYYLNSPLRERNLFRKVLRSKLMFTLLLKIKTTV